MPASELIERVAQLIRDAEPSAPEAMRPDLQLLLTRLREPARVAVVGRVKAGKSTLVNALLAQRVAPTDVSECTRVVTWFRYGHPQRVIIQLKDGSSLESQLTPEGVLPPELGVAVESVAHIEVYLANEALRWMTLIDTPGLGSVNQELSSSTEELLSASGPSHHAASGADAVVFLLNQVMMEDELTALQLFQSANGETGSGAPGNAVAVLSRADQLGDGRDSWDVAVELADHYAGVFRNDVSNVVPVIGLVAETAETAALTELDAKQLSALAAMETGAFERLLWSADRFVSSDAAVSSEARERLLALLDLYGIGRAVTFIRDGAKGAVALRRELSNMSGIGEVKRSLIAYFREQDHVLKVRSALDVLNRLTYAPSGDEGAGLAKLRADVEALRLDPVMHPVAELEAWHDCCSGRVDLPEEYLEDLRHLFAPGTAANKLRVGTDDPDDSDALRQVVVASMARWRTYMVTEATPAQVRVARVALRSYQFVWEGAQ